MGDIGLDLGKVNASNTHAANAIVQAAHAHSGELDVITLGPLTNITLALSLDPSIAHLIHRITIMGGTSDYYGNITPVSEYNIWADPEAADAVFTSTVPKLMIDWDISRKYATFNDTDAAELRAIGTESARVAVDSQIVLREFCRTTSGVDGFDQPEPIALAAATSPEIVTASTH